VIFGKNTEDYAAGRGVLVECDITFSWQVTCHLLEISYTKIKQGNKFEHT